MSSRCKYENEGKDPTYIEYITSKEAISDPLAGDHAVPELPYYTLLLENDRPCIRCLVDSGSAEEILFDYFFFSNTMRFGIDAIFNNKQAV